MTYALPMGEGGERGCVCCFGTHTAVVRVPARRGNAMVLAITRA